MDSTHNTNERDMRSSGTSDPHALKDRVLSAIGEGRVRMRPRWQFVLRAILWAAGTALILLAVVYLVSFIFFALRVSGATYVPVFGSPGLREFLFAVPWLLVLSALVVVGVGEILIRRYGMVRRRPVLLSLLGLIALVLVTSAMIERWHIHDRFGGFARSSHIPWADALYNGVDRMSGHNIYVGKVESIGNEAVVFETRGGEVLIAHTSSSTQIAPNTDLETGDMLVVFGERQGNDITALGIAEADPGNMIRFELRRVGRASSTAPRVMSQYPFVAPETTNTPVVEP